MIQDLTQSRLGKFEERPLRGAILMSHDIVDSVSGDRRPVGLCDPLVIASWVKDQVAKD
jgi:hypothetical protein